MKPHEIESLLPAVFRETVRESPLLAAFIEAMAALHAPSEEVLAHLDAYLDPYRTPDRFVPYLARWVDLDWLLAASPTDHAAPAPAPIPSGMGQLRELVAAAAYLAQWRGTARGLLRFLETATGLAGFAVDEAVPGPDGMAVPFHIAVTAPREAEVYRQMIEQIVQAEKPAHVTHELRFGKPHNGEGST